MAKPRKKQLPVDRFDQFIIGTRRLENGMWEAICYDKVNKVQHHFIPTCSHWGAEQDAVMLAEDAIKTNQFLRINPIHERAMELLRNGGTPEQWERLEKRWNAADDLMEKGSITP